ncbi:unnamed protein product [Rhizopus stolonifer]
MAEYLASIYGTEKDKVNCSFYFKEDFDLFYEDVFMELAKFGEVEEMVVCDNVGNAVESLNNRFYAGRPLYAELSPVTDFREACCRQHEISECNRGGFCNFMHLKHPTRLMKRELYEGQRMDVREKRREEMRRDDDDRRIKREPIGDDERRIKREPINDYNEYKRGDSHDRREY